MDQHHYGWTTRAKVNSNQFQYVFFFNYLTCIYLFPLPHFLNTHPPIFPCLLPFLLIRINVLFCSLGVEPVDRDVMNKPPRNVKKPMITRALIMNVLLAASLIVTGTLWVFWREVSRSSNNYYTPVSWLLVLT